MSGVLLGRECLFHALLAIITEILMTGTSFGDLILDSVHGMPDAVARRDSGEGTRSLCVNDDPIGGRRARFSDRAAAQGVGDAVQLRAQPPVSI